MTVARARRRTSTVWLEPREAQVLGPQLVEDGRLGRTGATVVEVRHGPRLRVTVPTALARNRLRAALEALRDPPLTERTPEAPRWVA